MVKAEDAVKWSFVAFAFVECLTGTGIIFGFSGLQMALLREGVYSERCTEDVSTEDGPCKEQKLALALIYSVGGGAFQVN